MWIKSFIAAALLLLMANCADTSSADPLFVNKTPGNGSFEHALLGAELNGIREANGRTSLVFDPRLQAAAQAHAQDMARRGFFSHTSTNGDDLGDRLKSANYPFCFGAENIAQGQQSAGEVMQAWMNSAGHRRNNLSQKARAFGAARAAGNTWVLVFGAEC